jgi:predicted CopG family antitoxin
MTSNQISIRKDIYEKLKKIKREKESFSDLIERLLGKSNINDVLDCFGIVDGKENQDFLDIAFEGQKQMRDSLNKKFSIDTSNKED